MSGVVEAIHLAGAHGAPVAPVESVRGEPGMGLEGDRHWGEGAEDLTLIEAEAVERLREQDGVDTADGSHRRNVTVRGVDLGALVGARFRIGEVEAIGTERCEPCNHLAKLLGTGGVPRPLVHTGLSATILAGGTIRVGDAVEVLGPAQQDG